MRNKDAYFHHFYWYSTVKFQPEQLGRKRKKNRHPRWKGRSKIIFVHRWHTVYPWATQVWTVQVHLYKDFFQHTQHYNICGQLATQKWNHRYGTWASAEFVIYGNPSGYQGTTVISQVYNPKDSTKKTIKTNKRIQQSSRIQNQWAKFNCIAIH